MVITIVVQGSLEMVKFTYINKIVTQWYGYNRFIKVTWSMNKYIHISRGLMVLKSDNVHRKWHVNVLIIQWKICE